MQNYKKIEEEKSILQKMSFEKTKNNLFKSTIFSHDHVNKKNNFDVYPKEKNYQKSIVEDIKTFDKNPNNSPKTNNFESNTKTKDKTENKDQENHLENKIIDINNAHEENNVYIKKPNQKRCSIYFGEIDDKHNIDICKDFNNISKINFWGTTSYDIDEELKDIRNDIKSPIYNPNGPNHKIVSCFNIDKNGKNNQMNELDTQSNKDNEIENPIIQSPIVFDDKFELSFQEDLNRKYNKDEMKDFHLYKNDISYIPKINVIKDKKISVSYIDNIKNKKFHLMISNDTDIIKKINIGVFPDINSIENKRIKTFNYNDTKNEPCISNLNVEDVNHIPEINHIEEIRKKTDNSDIGKNDFSFSCNKNIKDDDFISDKYQIKTVKKKDDSSNKKSNLRSNSNNKRNAKKVKFINKSVDNRDNLNDDDIPDILPEKNKSSKKRDVKSRNKIKINKINNLNTCSLEKDIISFKTNYFVRNTNEMNTLLKEKIELLSLCQSLLHPSNQAKINPNNRNKINLTLINSPRNNQRELSYNSDDLSMIKENDIFYLSEEKKRKRKKVHKKNDNKNIICIRLNNDDINNIILNTEINKGKELPNYNEKMFEKYRNVIQILENKSMKKKKKTKKNSKLTRNNRPILANNPQNVKYFKTSTKNNNPHNNKDCLLSNPKNELNYNLRDLLFNNAPKNLSEINLQNAPKKNNSGIHENQFKNMKNSFSHENNSYYPPDLRQNNVRINSTQKQNSPQINRKNACEKICKSFNMNNNEMKYDSLSQNKTLNKGKNYINKKKENINNNVDEMNNNFNILNNPINNIIATEKQEFNTTPKRKFKSIINTKKCLNNNLYKNYFINELNHVAHNLKNKKDNLLDNCSGVPKGKIINNKNIAGETFPEQNNENKIKKSNKKDLAKKIVPYFRNNRLKNENLSEKLTNNDIICKLNCDAYKINSCFHDNKSSQNKSKMKKCNKNKIDMKEKCQK